MPVSLGDTHWLWQHHAALRYAHTTYARDQCNRSAETFKYCCHMFCGVLRPARHKCKVPNHSIDARTQDACVNTRRTSRSCLSAEPASPIGCMVPRRIRSSPTNARSCTSRAHTPCRRRLRRPPHSRSGRRHAAMMRSPVNDLRRAEPSPDCPQPWLHAMGPRAASDRTQEPSRWRGRCDGMQRAEGDRPSARAALPLVSISAVCASSAGSVS